MTSSAQATPRSYPLAGLTAEAPGSENRIADRTARPRLGLRGPGVSAWCAANGMPFPEKINRCRKFDRGRIARLGKTEILLLPAPDAPRLPEIEGLPDVFDTYREETWGWFRFEGPGSEYALAQMTRADLRPDHLRPGDVAQTRLAGIDAVLVADQQSDRRAFDIFMDIASSEYIAEVFSERCPDFPLFRDS